MKKILLLFCIIGCSFPLFGQTAREVMEKVDARNDAVSSRSIVTLDLIEKTGRTESMVIERISYEAEGTVYSIILFSSPAGVKDTRFLSIEYADKGDDKWIYLPALRKSRRIASSESGSSFMGTDFSYDDMGKRDPDAYDYRMISTDETYAVYSCWVIEATPKEGTASHYSKIVFWIDKESFLAVKIDFYDPSGVLLKTSAAERIAQVQGYWTIIQNRMTTHQTGHQTLLAIKKLVFDLEIDPRIFTKNFLDTGRL